MTQDIVDCYCGDEEDDGTMLYCEKCHRWQHAVCVNWNDFTAPQKYICPTCQNQQIECICKTEGDYQHAIIQCSKCHLYQHKRHVGLGIGKNPPNYICSNCSSSYSGAKNLKIEPHLDFFPSFNEKMIPLSVTSLPFSIPSSKLLNKLKEFTYPTTPVNFASTMLISYRDLIFKSHPTLKFFEYVKYTPESNVKDASNFFGYLTKSVALMSNLSIPQIIQVFDHVISLLIYKKAIPREFRARINNSISEDDLIIPQSDRAEDYIQEEYKLVNFTPPTDEVELKLVSGHNAYPTLITLNDLREGDFICRVAGYCMDYEEIDQQNSIPDYAVFNVARSKLFINSTRVPNSPLFLHIRRGIVSNCEIRLFTSYLRGTKKKEIFAGIFATKHIIMQQLIDYDPTTGKNCLNEDEIAIHSGEELVLPFDLAPIMIKPDADWRCSSDQAVIDNDCSINIDDFKPLKPSMSDSFDFSFDFNPAPYHTTSYREHRRLKDDDSEPTETTLSNLFSQNEPIQMDFIIESNYGAMNNASNSDSDDETVHKPAVNSNEYNKGYDDMFLLTSKSDLKSLMNSENDPFEDRKRRHLRNMNLKNKHQTLSHLIPIDPLQGKKSWFQPMHPETEIPEMKIEYRDQWKPLVQPTVSAPEVHRKLTPAEFWKNDPADFVDVTEDDLE